VDAVFLLPAGIQAEEMRLLSDTADHHHGSPKSACA